MVVLRVDHFAPWTEKDSRKTEEIEVPTSHAVINPNQLLPPKQRQRPRRQRHTCQRRAHTRSLRVAYTVDIVDTYPRFRHRLPDKPYHPCPVVLGCVLWQETFAGRGVEGVADVGEDEGWLSGRRFGGGGVRGAGFRVLDYADAELVGGAFEAEG